MRVLLAADFYPPAPGGLEAHVRRLARELVRNGHEVAVVAGGSAAGGAGGAPVAEDDGVTVYRAGLVPLVYRDAARAFHPPWPDPRFRRLLARVVDRFDPDVVHAHGWCEFSAVAVAGRRPVVVTLHDYGLRCPKKTLLRGGEECARGRGLRCARCPGAEQGTLKRCVLGAVLGRTAPRLAGRVARFLAVSGHVARRHLEALPGPVEVIPNFLDPPPGPYTDPAGSQVLFVGPADRHKGLPVLLRAREHLPPDLGARLVVVGAPVPADPPGDVEFAGRLTGDPLWARYRSAAVVAVPPIWADPCPTVVLEALAHGRPVVGSRAGGIPDLVADGVTGLLVPPGEPAALAAALAALLSDRSRLVAMGRAARERADLFATATVVRRIEAVYGEVLADRVPA